LIAGLIEELDFWKFKASTLDEIISLRILRRLTLRGGFKLVDTSALRLMSIDILRILGGSPHLVDLDVGKSKLVLVESLKRLANINGDCIERICARNVPALHFSDSQLKHDLETFELYDGGSVPSLKCFLGMKRLSLLQINGKSKILDGDYEILKKLAGVECIRVWKLDTRFKKKPKQWADIEFNDPEWRPLEYEKLKEIGMRVGQKGRWVLV
jgi:hypothetical protein